MNFLVIFILFFNLQKNVKTKYNKATIKPPNIAVLVPSNNNKNSSQRVISIIKYIFLLLVLNNESKIENTLSKLSNDSSKLLYLISYIFEKGKINKQQKIKLKEYVSQEKELVFNILNNYKNITNFID